ncbi:MAG TPA: ABC transporter substrate binding protein [Candidatus Methanoperedens sp.]|nr:ABC transporter substrate binding protein [Candidatus Methanoperedens sp.]
MALLLPWLLCGAGAAQAARCLYVSSYHAGYEWNDGIERGLEPILAGKCELRKFYLDGKRHLESSYSERMALEAKALIEEWKPDVVIAADDLVSKHLVAPFYRDASVPFVFCGINWTAELYGYPYRNATGMIEVGPIDSLVAEVRAAVKEARRGVFLSADELTQLKEFAMSEKKYGELGILMSHVKVRTMAEWEAAYARAQSADFIVLGNNAGISDWDGKRALRYVFDHSRIFTATYLDWMAPYAMLTMAKIADEQGEWAAKVAVMILGGARPGDIPIVANRRWNTFVNPKLLEKVGIRLSPDLMRRAVKIAE